jgi:hypothetical protein
MKQNSKISKANEINEKDSLLAQLTKKIMNPVPLNIRLRQDHNLDDSYRLVYLIDNERTLLIVGTLVNLLFPIVFIFLGVFAYAEYTGASQLGTTFDHPYLYVAGFSSYLSLVYFMANRNMSLNLMRIYYNASKDQFVSFRKTGMFFKYEMETFTSKDVIYRFDPRLTDNKSKIMHALTRNFGNIYIKNQLREVNFAKFSSDQVLVKMIGQKNTEYIKSKLK